VRGGESAGLSSLRMSGAAKDPIVGIDLGTTNSLVAIADDRGPRIIPDEQGRALLPSVVRYELGEQGRLRTVVGHDARAKAVLHPLVTVSSVKRLMGRSRADAEAGGDLPYLSYRVIEGEHNTARVALPIGEDGKEEKVVSPPEVSAVILRTLKDQASRALGVEVRRAVVTVPAYFDNAQREATKDAGRLAGLEVVRIVPEPTAAALAYGIGVRPGSEDTQTVAVYDLGGGTFDVSILRLTPREAEGGREFFSVLSTAGDTHLGGDDVDFMLVDLFTRDIRGVLGREESRLGAPTYPLELDASTRQALRAFAEGVKIRLSTEESAAVRVELGGGKVYERIITRGELEGMIGPWVDRTIDACRRALKDAKRRLGTEGVQAVVMVGGSTRIPLVRRRVGEFFGLEPYTALDPDTVVALGAAVQASILAGVNTESLLLDVIPLSLGIETVGGAVAKIIVRNSTVPARATEMFSTSVDGQTSIKLHILQGEREMAADCRSLGEFHLRGLPPMPAGIPQVQVEFLVDANGVLNVSAVERRSGKRASLQVVPNHGLTREEVEKIESESFAHAKEDMARHRIVDLIANSKLDLKWIGARFEKYGARLEPAARAELATRIQELKGFVAAAEREWTGVDADAFYKAKDALDRGSVRLQEIGIAESLRGEAGQGNSGA
jgi:molecular chaperone DnaK (HSP70)